MIPEKFKEVIHSVTESREYRSMKQFRHHIGSTAYRHSIKVAYLCYLHCEKHGKNCRNTELLRGALLHDFYLYDCHAKGARLRHCTKHPRIALENAQKIYPDLSETERDIIKHHMFPVTPVPPHTREGWIVCMYDKVATISDCISGIAEKGRRSRIFRSIMLAKSAMAEKKNKGKCTGGKT